jgi:hypothetical protein
VTIHPGTWHIEFGRGAVLTTLPFAMVETLLVSLELESVCRSTVEFTKLVAKRFRAENHARAEVRPGRTPT